MNCDKSSRTEIKNAIKKLKNGKAAGPDEIPTEAIKADINISTEILHSLFEKVWEDVKGPEEWRKGFVIKLPKNGDLIECKKNATISPGKSVEQSGIGEVESCSGCRAPRTPSRFPTRLILHRSCC